jgi:hypothetical protein
LDATANEAKNHRARVGFRAQRYRGIAGGGIARRRDTSALGSTFRAGGGITRGEEA